MNVIDYMVIKAPAAGNLTILVKEAIVDGWQPLGGVAVSPLGHNYSLGVITLAFSQAMVKYEELVTAAEELAKALPEINKHDYNECVEPGCIARRPDMDHIPGPPDVPKQYACPDHASRWILMPSGRMTRNRCI